MTESLQPQFIEVLNLINTAQQKVISTANQEPIKLYIRQFLEEPDLSPPELWDLGGYIGRFLNEILCVMYLLNAFLIFPCFDDRTATCVVRLFVTANTD